MMDYSFNTKHAVCASEINVCCFWPKTAFFLDWRYS